jgi:hypothetical protein
MMRKLEGFGCKFRNDTDAELALHGAFNPASKDLEDSSSSGVTNRKEGKQCQTQKAFIGQ